MIPLIDLSIEMQKRVIDAHEQSLAAAKKAMDSANAGVVMQQVIQDATKANLAAWDKWISLWGWRK